MKRHQTICWVIVGLVFASMVESAFAKRVSIQDWQCDLEFSTGFDGVLFMSRSQGKVRGGIKSDNADNGFNHRIEGTWVERTLNINRHFSPADEFALSAVLIRTTKQGGVLAGRYGQDFESVVVGNCEFLSERFTEVEDDKPETKPDKPITKAGPSTNKKMLPYKPTTNDRPEFTVTASHSDGVRSISIMLDGRLAKKCMASRCVYKAPRLTAGKHVWRADAVSKSGYKNAQYTTEFVVSDASQRGNCTVKGQATGSRAASSRIFFVNLYGPNNNNTFKGTARFTNGQYQFNNLSPGTYSMIVDTRGDTAVRVSPTPTSVRCRQRGTVTRDFRFQ